MHYFKAGIKTIKISEFAWWEKGDKPTYLVGIANSN